MTADSAATFAGAAVISALSMADWQISQDVETAMTSAVDALDSSPDRVEVTLHNDWIDVSAATGDVVALRRCFPRRPFRTRIDCREQAAAGDRAGDRPPASSTA